MAILGKKDLDKIRHTLNEISPYPWSGQAGGRIQDIDTVPVCSVLHTTPEDAKFIQLSPVIVSSLLDTIAALRNIIIDVGGNPNVRAKFNFNAQNLKLADRMHNTDGLSLAQVSIELCCDRKTLSQHMKAAGITVRSQGQSQQVRRNGKGNGKHGDGPVVFSRDEALAINSVELRSGK